MGSGLNWVLAQQAECKFTYLVHIQRHASTINFLIFWSYIQIQIQQQIQIYIFSSHTTQCIKHKLAHILELTFYVKLHTYCDGRSSKVFKHLMRTLH